MTPCDEWTGTVLNTGYGQIRLGYVDGKRIRAGAHQLMWWQNYGYPGDNMVIRHLCDNPPCVNIDHLQAGTQKENIGDAVDSGAHISQARKEKTHCVNGHERTPENTRTYAKGKSCKVCQLETGRLRREREKCVV